MNRREVSIAESARALLRRLAVFASWALMVLPTQGSADEFRPAYLQITAADATHYDVVWRVPALDANTLLRLSPVFPGGSVEAGPRSRAYADGAMVQRWRVEVPGGLAGRTISFDGLAATRVDVLVRVVGTAGAVQTGRLTPLESTFRIAPTLGAFDVVRTYAVLGIEHILLGFDHLLFVLALFVLVDGGRRLVATITAFTAAHSVTLVAATLGIVRVPGPPVEAVIALSIVFVAVEIVRARRGVIGVAQKNPWLVAFAFGLLHGLGFAGALAEVGLPPQHVPAALLFFNVGVEIGQLVFLAAVAVAAVLARRMFAAVGPSRLAAARLAVAYAIGGVASFWLIERVAAF